LHDYGIYGNGNLMPMEKQPRGLRGPARLARREADLRTSRTP